MQFGHTITRTLPDGTVEVESIPPTPEEIAAYKDLTIDITKEVYALVKEIEADRDAGKEPNTNDQLKAAAGQAFLAVLNNWLVANGAEAVEVTE